MGLLKLELDHVDGALGYQIRSNTKLEECQKNESEEFEIEGAKLRFCQTLMFAKKSFCWHPR